VSRAIDLYLDSLVKFGATGVVLAGNANVRFQFPAGDRHANQSTPNELLLHMVQETATPDAAGDVAAGRKASYTCHHKGADYTVAVEPDAGAWRVRITLGAAPAARPAVAKPKPAPEPAAEFAIERTSYADAAADAGASAEPESIAGSGGDGSIDQLLREMTRMGASDLHLCTNCGPYVRHDGDIKTLEGYPAYSPEMIWDQLREIMPERNREEFERRNDTDFAYAIEGLSRFRVNVFRDRYGPGSVIRAIPFEILTADQLGLPKKVLDLCYLTKGLVLVTGPTGSGKSTTLATLIDYINRNRADHIITIEDPIEFVHDNKKCLVNQREVREHTDSFKNALRAALREDPDIVLVGELRDLETIAIAVETAETGHLVFGTLHTTTAPSTVDRVIDQFPADRQEQIRQMLSESLAGVIAQTLCRKVGGGRVAAYEILLANSAVRNLVREKKTFQLFSLMQTGRAQGMQTLSMALDELVRAKKVEPLEAYTKAVNKQEFKQILQKQGISVDLGAVAPDRPR